MRAALALMISACTFSHSKAVVSLAAVDAMLFACDATQTYAASDGGMWTGRVRELDPVQGTHPTGARMYGLMAVNTAFAIAITAAPLPDWVKAGALGVIGANVAHTVVNNNQFAQGCGL